MISQDSAFHFRSQLRAQCKYEGLSGYWLKQTNLCLTEIMGDMPTYLRQITGFSGSTGWALFTEQEDILFVDGRYTLQAKKEVGDFMTVASLGVSSMLGHLQRLFPTSSTLGYHPWLHSLRDAALFASFEKHRQTCLPSLLRGFFEEIDFKDPLDESSKDRSAWSSPIKIGSQKHGIMPSHNHDSILQSNSGSALWQTHKINPSDLLDVSWSAAHEQNVVDQGNTQAQEDSLVLDQTLDALQTRDHASPLIEMLVAHPDKWAGVSREEKWITWVAYAKKNHLAGLWLSPESLAWLLNLRGSGLSPYSRLFQAYGWATPDSLTVFSDAILPFSCPEWLLWKPWKEVFHWSPKNDQAQVWFPEDETPLAIAHLVKETYKKDLSPIALWKSNKNPQEQEGMREAHRQEALAWITWAAKLYDQEGPFEWNEYTAGEELERIRQENPEYRGPSFPSIVGFQGHGAIIHYRAQSKTALPLESGPLLVDCGAQMASGTTDATRVLWLGDQAPTSEIRFHYTAILKGHIALTEVMFPQGKTGKELAVLAETPLWSMGLKTPHGIGHGVGAALCVHEAPPGFGDGLTPLQPGMVISNEPGYYKEGCYGIRLENLLLAQPHPSHSDFLYFETLTCLPYASQLIDFSLLTDHEKRWLRNYHETILDQMSPHLSHEALLWFQKACSPFLNS